jgi:hypothetical protein
VFGPATLERAREREADRQTPRAPEPVPAEPMRDRALDWASAIGNQAVARLVRQAAEPDMTEMDAPEGEAEEEAVPPEVQELEAQGIGMDAMAGLEAVDDMTEGDLPD